MSRFFRDDSTRSSASQDSIEEYSSSRSQITRQTNHNGSSVESVSTAVATTSPGPLVSNESQQRDILLHALLEERCLRQTQAEFQEERLSDRVRLVANSRYQYLSQQLSRLGLVSTGFDDHGLSATRQQVRDGLDLLLGGLSEPTLPGTRMHITDSTQELSRLNLNFSNLRLASRMIEQPRLMTDRMDVMRLPRSVDSSVPRSMANLLIDTRYRREFEEVAMLGRGGFGVVHHCKHKWDGLSYAIKRIPLSSKRLKNIQERGQAEVDDMLLELKTLARLDHPNVVRYFSGWVELCSFEGASSTPSIPSAGIPSGTVASASRTSTLDLDRNGDDFSNGFITFGNSLSQRSAIVGAEEAEASNHISEQIHRTNTHATVSDDDVESISRSASSNAELSAMSTDERRAQTCLALHIQMGMYPLTLADILFDSIENSARHCFHIEPAARLLSALIDGVAYLHEQGVIHRDIKPANIFLTAQADSGNGTCRSCHAQGHTNAAYKLRIGDFGLVAAVAQDEFDSEVAPVGTEMYHPTSPRTRHDLHSLDWYAVGMIALELIWPFPTRMERYETLRGLKKGEYPYGFGTRFGQASTQITELIEHLLRPAGTINVERLRQMLGLIDSQ